MYICYTQIQPIPIVAVRDDVEVMIQVVRMLRRGREGQKTHSNTASGIAVQLLSSDALY